MTFSKKRVLAFPGGCFSALVKANYQKIPTLFTNPFQNPKTPNRYFLGFSRLCRHFPLSSLIFPTNEVKVFLACAPGSRPKLGKSCKFHRFLALSLTSFSWLFWCQILAVFRAWFFAKILFFFKICSAMFSTRKALLRHFNAF